MSEEIQTFEQVDKVERKKVFFSFLFPGLFIAIISLIKLIEIELKLDFGTFGILPRTLSGLKGILFSPLIHGDWNHLFNNSIPLFILGGILFYFYKAVAFRVIILSYILSGLYTWISARHSFHIGASGLVYALFGFLFISGFLRKHIPLIALSFLVAFLYGSLIWGILPWKREISWEGHFWGLLVGVILAFFYQKKGPQKKEFIWEDEEEEGDEVVEILKNEKEPRIIYHFRPKDSTNETDD